MKIEMAYSLFESGKAKFQLKKLNDAENDFKNANSIFQNNKIQIEEGLTLFHLAEISYFKEDFVAAKRLYVQADSLFRIKFYQKGRELVSKRMEELENFELVN